MSEIVQVGAPVLRAHAADVPPELLGTAELEALEAQMIAAMRAAPGVGLAAPQIGVGLRMIVLEDRPEYLAKISDEERAERGRVAFDVRTFVNPSLRWVDEETRLFFEGCLSVPGLVALVERASEVEVSGLDVHGRPHSWRVGGWPARILQHEVDHVNGTLYVDRMLPRTLATAAHARALYAGKSMAEVRAILGARYVERLV